MATRDVRATRSPTSRPTLEAELRRLELELGFDDFAEFTVDELDRRAAAGEWPWTSPPSTRR
jgi:hypothetical protein